MLRQLYFFRIVSYFLWLMPTLITIARIVMVPFIVMSLINHDFVNAFWLFVIAACSDAIDGNMARWLGNESFLGAFLDPVADKILLLSCFCTFTFMQSPMLTVPVWFFVLILAKECLLVTAYLISSFFFGVYTVKPTWLGKITTCIQVFFIAWLFICYFFQWYPLKTCHFLIFVMAAGNLAALIHYCYRGITRLEGVQ